jgi:hypothetical protein
MLISKHFENVDIGIELMLEYNGIIKSDNDNYIVNPEYK